MLWFIGVNTFVSSEFAASSTLNPTFVASEWSLGMARVNAFVPGEGLSIRKATIALKASEWELTGMDKLVLSE